MENCQKKALFEAGLSEGGNPQWNSPYVTKMSGPKSEEMMGRHTLFVFSGFRYFTIDDLKHSPSKMGTEFRPDCRPRA